MEKVCPVCGEIAQDGVDDQVAIWGIGVHNAKKNSLTMVNNSQEEMFILHMDCIMMFLEGKLIECEDHSHGN